MIVIFYDFYCVMNLRTYFIAQEDIIVARAPGRLDVVGGIADYSGSLVLQVKLTFLAVNNGIKIFNLS